MTVLITRPEHDAKKTADFLISKGIDCVIDSLISIKATLIPLPENLNSYHDIIFTSKNGVRRFCEQSNHREMIAWCVGDQTAQEAKDFGFKTVYSADGNAQDLENLIIQKSASNRFLRISRGDQKDMLSYHLKDKGYDITALPLYTTKIKTSFSKKTMDSIRQGKITDLLIYSPHTAKVTQQAFLELENRDACRKITVWCISKNTADALAPDLFKDIVVAAQPKEDSLLRPLLLRE